MKPALEFEFASKAPGLRALTTTRIQNIGMNTGEDPRKVLAARLALWSRLGLDPSRSVFLRQVHGEGLQVVGREAAGRGLAGWDDALPDCDLAVARESGILLCVGHADCLAVLIADPVKRICGAAHAGWRGAVLKVAARLARAMKELGCRPRHMLAGLSACLGPCHLELGPEQYGLLEGRPGCGPLEAGHFKLDLQAHAQAELEAEGIPAASIERQQACTWDQNSLFFSHRAEHGKAGRQMSVIGFVP